MLDQSTTAESADFIALPGPRGGPLLGALPSILRQGMFRFLCECIERYGDACQVPLVGQRYLALLAHPDAFEQVLVSQRAQFEKGWFYAPARPLAGNGLIISEGDYWARQRRMMQPSFRPRCIHTFLPAMASCVSDMLDSWERRRRDGELVELQTEMARLTQRIVARTLFGVEIDESSGDTVSPVTQCMEIIGERVSSGLNVPLVLPTPKNLRFRRARRELDRFLHQIIRQARAEPERGETSLLDLMIAARDEDTGEAMTDAQLRDELVTLYLGGHETTSLTLTWAFILLARHPEIAARLVDEVSSCDDPAASDPQVLDGLEYTRMVIDEVLRVRPPAWMVGRVAVEDTTVAGHPIARGCGVMLGLYFLHHHPDFWPEPARFRPDRFTAAAKAGRHRYAYMPFTAGPRVCIGNRFSLYESVLTLAMIVRRFRVTLAGDDEIGIKATATLRPDRPVPVRLTRADRPG